MELSKKLLNKYIGGQLVFTIKDNGILQRGQVTEIQFQHNAINVKFGWRAENSGTPSEPSYDWAVIEPRDLLIEVRLFNDINLLDDDCCPIPLDNCPESELEAETIKLLFFESLSLNERVIFLPPGHETEIRICDLRMDYIYAICRARKERGTGEKLICCLNSEFLPELLPSNVIFSVSRKTTYYELPALKKELIVEALENGYSQEWLAKVINLAPKEPQQTIKGVDHGA